MALFDKDDTSTLSQWWWSIDRWLFGAILALMVFGVFLVSSASPPNALRLGKSDFYFLYKHFIFLMPTIFLMVSISFFDRRTIRRLGIIGMIIGILALIATLAFGIELNGSRRWLMIAGLSIQVTEFVKPVFAISAAWLFAGQHQDEKFPGYFMSCILCGTVLTLTIQQPDLGMTMLFLLIWSAQFFMAGLRLSIVTGLGVAGLAALALAYLTLPHVSSRIDRFINPASGDTYQVDKSIEAFRHGGLFGTGPGQGDIKNVLPDAHTDFIFAIAGEELGLILTIMLIGLYGLIIWRGFKHINKSNNLFVMLAIGGILTQIAGQAFIHMGSSLHILPAKGMTLPLVSAGGSSMMGLGIGLGCLLAFTRKENR